MFDSLYICACAVEAPQCVWEFEEDTFTSDCVVKQQYPRGSVCAVACKADGSKLELTCGDQSKWSDTISCGKRDTQRHTEIETERKRRAVELVPVWIVLMHTNC